MTTVQQRQGEDDSSSGRKKSEEHSQSSAKRDRKKEKTPFRKNENPFRIAPFRPRFGGRFFRSRFMKDENAFWRPGFSFRFQRYHPMAGVRPYHRTFRGAPGRHSFTPQSAGLNKNGKDCKGMSKDQKSSLQSPMSSTPANGREPLSFTVQSKHVSQGAQESSNSKDQRVPPSVMRAAMRNRAIQQKRHEIEEVYRQDCDTFGLVVKMLIAKDPSLEHPIQASLRENLQEIGLRCAAAMQQFIQEYDLVHP